MRTIIRWHGNKRRALQWKEAQPSSNVNDSKVGWTNDRRLLSKSTRVSRAVRLSRLFDVSPFAIEVDAVRRPAPPTDLQLRESSVEDLSSFFNTQGIQCALISRNKRVSREGVHDAPCGRLDDRWQKGCRSGRRERRQAGGTLSAAVVVPPPTECPETFRRREINVGSIARVPIRGPTGPPSLFTVGLCPIVLLAPGWPPPPF